MLSGNPALTYPIECDRRDACNFQGEARGGLAASALASYIPALWTLLLRTQPLGNQQACCEKPRPLLADPLRHPRPVSEQPLIRLPTELPMMMGTSSA